MADQLAWGPDLDAIVEKVRPYGETGYTDIALIQIGDSTLGRFLAEAAELACRRRAELGRSARAALTSRI